MKSLKTYALIAALPLLRLFYWLGGFVPRDPQRWAFGAAANSFTDNAKYLFAHVIDEAPSIRAAWITANKPLLQRLRSMGVPALYRWSPAGLWHALRSGHWFYISYPSDINYYASRGACLVNLWHGIPLKKIEFDIDSGTLAQRYKQPTFLERYLFFAANFKRPDWVLSTSRFVSRASFASAFRVPEGRCLNFGYPRLDPFFWPAEKRKRWSARWGSPAVMALIERASQHRKLFVYMPTWRDHQPRFLDDVGWDFATLNQQLQADDALLVLKLHMNTPADTLARASGHSHIHVMDPKDDIYPLLPDSTSLITDYSSIFLDYLLLDRPICFFTFDLQRYLSESRGMYHAYTAFAQGPQVSTADGVAQFLHGDMPDAHEAGRSALRNQLFDHADAGACERIVAFFDTRPHATPRARHA